MSRKHNATGRSTGDGHFIQMHEWFFKSHAWQAASVYEQALYLAIKRRYNGRNNGDIPMSHREAEQLLNCSNRPIAKAFAGLEEKGFIKPVTKGSFDWKVAKQGKNHGRSTRWELTELPPDLPQRVLGGGTKEFMSWKPKEKSAVCPEHTSGTLSAYHEKSMVCSEHTMKAGVYAHGTR
ncbi:hypothetical protein BTR14_20590 [Rhizobium rhizosphaerae]|uniref:Helix-turn-helix domain-containing protein n=1 Tax=Xaviernesmea rhizosphaerae TaxID=1672749 RepID=A0ABX3P844_9HYPH|nr:hypothetical protein [Xaviernesmea rhizosphaerae]OQP84215.1 hypothetical protein BTR14_20590 [Xaviernesmea rhizosphaerae]